jgi:quercetin dioxygenase-like cupin family protein
MTTSTHPKFPDLMRVCAKDAEFFSPEKGLLRRVLAHNEKMMLVEHRMEATWVGARHSHPHDQMVYVIAGRLQFSCGQDEFEACAGDSFVLRGGIEHSARALGEPAIALDVFTPYREDYVRGGASSSAKPTHGPERDAQGNR